MVHKMIRNMQERPVHEREKIALFGAAVAGGLLVLIWVALLPYRFHQNNQAIKQDFKPFALIKDNVVEVYANVSKGFESAKTSTNSK